ncbi:c-type cytochrome [Marinibaculum pumilum]|uniref:C-type cytochrome n=1 Tax=Marinibaculum pumilum TaxID=1766165 RepID=A0ABV7L817_9PROT
MIELRLRCQGPAAVLSAAVFAAGVLLGAASAPAAAQQLQPGDSDIGRGIAMRWCAACHVVRGAQASGGDVGPTFDQIAGKGQGLDWLDAFLADPHPPMPDMSLTRQEIRDLRAYIESLRAAR